MKVYLLASRWKGVGMSLLSQNNVPCESFRAALVCIGRGRARRTTRKTKTGTRYWRGHSQCAKPSETRQRRSKACQIIVG